MLLAKEKGEGELGYSVASTCLYRGGGHRGIRDSDLQLVDAREGKARRLPREVVGGRN